jgi:PAS domain S-box-containing protein
VNALVLPWLVGAAVGLLSVGAILISLSQRRAARKAQAALDSLNESEARFRELAENINQVFWVYTPGRDRILYVSPAYEAIWGRSSAALLADPRTWLDAVHPDDRDRLRVETSTEADMDVEYRILRPDGSLRWVSERSFPVRGPDGAVLRIVGIAEDISAQKRAEEELRRRDEELRQSQKMEAIGRLAGGIAHDFNNLLTIINGYCEVLQLDPATRRPEIEEIARAGARAAELTGQLLVFSRKQVLAPKVLSINDAVRDMEKMLRRLIGEHITLQTRLAPGAGMVRADPGQLTQVLMNLAINARDAMPDGGGLVIETSSVDIDDRLAAAHPGARPGPHVLLTVTDTGSGIDPDVLARIFEPFFTTKSGRGTGLGLAMVHGIVHQSGGHITVGSVKGLGTTFRVYLPRISTPPDQQTTVMKRPATGSETILVVEDEDAVRALIRGLLTGRGYQVIEATNGEEALEVAAKAGRIDLLLTDVIMPRMGGRETAERLAERRPGLRVLYMSGYSADVLSKEGFLEPGIALLPKPFRPDALLEKVRKVLDRIPRAEPAGS